MERDFNNANKSDRRSFVKGVLAGAGVILVGDKVILPAISRQLNTLNQGLEITAWTMKADPDGDGNVTIGELNQLQAIMDDEPIPGSPETIVLSGPKDEKLARNGVVRPNETDSKPISFLTKRNTLLLGKIHLGTYTEQLPELTNSTETMIVVDTDGNNIFTSEQSVEYTIYKDVITQELLSEAIYKQLAAECNGQTHCTESIAVVTIRGGQASATTYEYVG